MQRQVIKAAIDMFPKIYNDQINRNKDKQTDQIKKNKNEYFWWLTLLEMSTKQGGNWITFLLSPDQPNLCHTKDNYQLLMPPFAKNSFQILPISCCTHFWSICFKSLFWQSDNLFFAQNDFKINMLMLIKARPHENQNKIFLLTCAP